MELVCASSARNIHCWLIRAAAVPLVVMAFASEGATPAGIPFRPNPVVDARGYIDVWALRRDVIAVESLTPTADADHCYPEGDPDAPPMSRRQLERERREGEACEARAKSELERFQSAKTLFNQSWIPKIKEAISKGDVVAEVIFLLCVTTDVLDRGDEATTCHENKQAAAMKRLKEIGFVPAYTPCNFRMAQWNRAFRFCTGEHDNWPTDHFRFLKLNRSRALTPGYLTWGRELHFGGGAWPYTGRSISWPDDEAKTANDLEIDGILRREPRWSVFLLTRVGRHEWVPEGSQSASGRLDPAWQGRYQLVRGADSWTEPLQPMTGIADIHQDGDDFRVTITSGAAAPLADVAGCRLRYSGGLTYRPKLTPSGKQSAQLTSLGYFYEGGGRKAGSFWDDGAADAALAPLDPKKRYRQVLMQCDGGEADQNSRLRFLLLAGDTLLEFAADTPYSPSRLSVRHFNRVP